MHLLCRLRAILEHLADTYPLPSGLQDLRPSFTIIKDTFAMRIRLVHPDTFTGDALSVMFEDSFYLVDAFQHNDLITGIDEDAAAYISLPASLFEGLNLGTDEARLVYGVYLKDTLFMRRSNYVEEQELVNEVGGIVMSGRISSGVQVSNLEEQVQLSFAKNPVSFNKPLAMLNVASHSSTSVSVCPEWHQHTVLLLGSVTR